MQIVALLDTYITDYCADPTFDVRLPFTTDHNRA